jgi:hypothetical protein
MGIAGDPAFGVAVSSSWCDVCATMFSPAGFQALWGDVGYDHLDATTCAANAAAGCLLCSLIMKTASANFRRCQTVPLVFKANCSRAKPIPGSMLISNAAGGGESVPRSLDTLEAEVWYEKNGSSNVFTCRLAIFTDQGQYGEECSCPNSRCAHLCYLSMLLTVPNIRRSLGSTFPRQTSS